jgi:glyoxylase-like metal-dependent hydrolase (beta-lactamase superfamily II)
MTTSSQKPIVHGIFDKATWTITYIVHQGIGTACAIIDSVLDYDPKSGRTTTTSAEKVVEYVKEHQLKVEWILETHAHADHVSAAPYLKQHLGGKIAIGDHITQVQKVFKGIFNLETVLQTRRLAIRPATCSDEEFKVGELVGKVLFVPGHTPACVAYQFGDAVFVGDTMFMPDVGTARCDFPGGDARTLVCINSKNLELACTNATLYVSRLPANGSRPFAFETTVAEQRAKNIHVHDGITEAQFVEMRTKRDATLGMPVLILPAVQINIRAGELPPKEANGVSYLKIPLNAL